MLKFIRIIAVLAAFIAGPVLAEVTVVITDPQNGAEFEQYSLLFVTAAATNPGGSVIRVDLYYDQYWMGSDYTAPFVMLCSNFLLGPHQLVAKALCADPGSSNTYFVESAPVSITTVPQPPNILPSVSITSPAAGSEFNQGDAVPVTVDASDSDGYVTYVYFYVNGGYRSFDSIAPFSFNWVASNSGVCQLTVLAYDNRGGSTLSDPVSVTVHAAIYTIDSAVPNPLKVGRNYNGPMVIGYTAADQSGLTFNIYNANNSLIRTLTDPDSDYDVEWDGKNAGGKTVSPGTYFVRMFKGGNLKAGPYQIGVTK